jgi:hypothetical protein
MRSWQALGMDASSMAFRGREVLGDEFLWNYALFQGIEIPVLNGWWATHLVRGRQLLDSFNYRQWDPRIIHLGLSENSFPVPFPTVQSGPLSETDPLKADADLGGGTKGNYIQWIVQVGKRLASRELSRPKTLGASLQDSAPVHAARIRSFGDTRRSQRGAPSVVAGSGARDYRS